jgi:hypothetical protein
MQNANRSGIICDLCALELIDDFKYYSYDFRMANVFDGMRPARSVVLRNDVTKSIDVCTQCHNKITHNIVKNYTTATQKKINPKSVLCDFSGNLLSGTYVYYLVSITELKVVIDKFYTCKQCQRPSQDPTCKNCKTSAMTRGARVTTDANYLEASCSSDEYSKLIHRVTQSQEKAQDWSTKS